MKNQKPTLLFFVVTAIIMILTSCGCKHEWVPATCTEPKTCLICGATEGMPIGHQWKIATCTEPKTCTVCGATLGNANGHQITEWAITVEPTCTSNGLKTGVCVTCGEEQAEEIDMIDHSFGQWKVETQPTCTVTGKETAVCEMCGISTTRIIPMADHSFTEWETEVEPTCKKAGRSKRVCKDCGKKETEEIARLPHTDGGWEIEIVASHPLSASRVRKCTVCGMLLEQKSYVLSESEKLEWYKENCQTINYNELSRTPDKYKGQYVKYRCYIKQIVSEASSSEYYSTYRAATSGTYSDYIYLCIDNYGTGVRILEGDWIIVYGVFSELSTFETILGGTTTMPKIIVDYYE